MDKEQIRDPFLEFADECERQVILDAIYGVDDLTCTLCTEVTNPDDLCERCTDEFHAWLESTHQDEITDEIVDDFPTELDQFGIAELEPTAYLIPAGKRAFYLFFCKGVYYTVAKCDLDKHKDEDKEFIGQFTEEWQVDNAIITHSQRRKSKRR